MPQTKTLKFSKMLLSALKILISIYDGTEDLREDFPESKRDFQECVKFLEDNSALNEIRLNEVKKILKFQRSYHVLEFVDKMQDVGLWFSESFQAAMSFYKRWGLPKNTVVKIIKKYERKLLEGFLELTYRKGRGATEVDAIRSFRYSMGGRLPEEYFVNLVRGWISEDLVSIWIVRNSATISVELVPMAHDAERQIRFKSARSGKGRVISGEPDFLVKLPGKKRQKFLEIQRVDRGRLKMTNKTGERPVNIPGHRPDVEKEAIESQKDLVLFLFNEGTKTNPPEIATIVNPKQAKKLIKKDGELYIWAKFVPANSPQAKKQLTKAIF